MVGFGLPLRLTFIGISLGTGMLCTINGRHLCMFVYVLQLSMSVMFNTGRANYSLDKFHINPFIDTSVKVTTVVG